MTGGDSNNRCFSVYTTQSGTARTFGRKYPFAMYGGAFKESMHFGNRGPYNRWGNGSAMRVSPVGFAFDGEDSVLAEAKKTAEFTLNHRKGVKGAQATALAIFRARTGVSKEDSRAEITDRFSCDLSKTADEIRPDYRFTRWI